MANVIIYTEAGGVFPLKVTTSRDTDYTCDISENTVETGYRVADTVINKPIELNITHVVTTVGEKNGNIFAYWESIYNNIIDNRYRLKVQTPDYLYNNMILTSCKKSRSKTHQKCEFTLHFKQVMITSDSVVAIPQGYDYLKTITTKNEEITQGEPSTDELFTERSEGKAVEEVQESKSLLASITDYFRNMI